MQIAIVGCGFVADYYIQTLQKYPDLKLIGVTDINPKRYENFSEFHNVKSYPSLDNLLDDSNVEIVVNLTNPRNHYEVSKASLLRESMSTPKSHWQ